LSTLLLESISTSLACYFVDVSPQFFHFPSSCLVFRLICMQIERRRVRMGTDVCIYYIYRRGQACKTQTRLRCLFYLDIFRLAGCWLSSLIKVYGQIMPTNWQLKLERAHKFKSIWKPDPKTETKPNWTENNNNNKEHLVSDKTLSLDWFLYIFFLYFFLFCCPIQFVAQPTVPMSNWFFRAFSVETLINAGNVGVLA